MSEVYADWDIKYLGGNTLELSLKSQYLTMTGSPFYIDIPITFPFKINKIAWKHTDGTPAESSDVLFYTVFVQQYAFMARQLGDYTNATDVVLVFGNDWKFSSTTLRLYFNTTNTHRIYPIITIERL